MEDLFKNAFYTGIGLVNNTASSLRKGVEDMVEKGKISAEDGKKVVAGMEEDMSEKREEFEAVLSNVVGVALAKLNLPTGDAIKSLEKRIKSLEIKVGLLSKELEATKAPAKKAATAKKATATVKKAATTAKVTAKKVAATVKA